MLFGVSGSMKTTRGQWTDLKNILLILVVIIVMVIIIKNYVYAPVSEAAKCKGLGGECRERCDAGYYPVPGIACAEGQTCCQAENPEQERV